MKLIRDLLQRFRDHQHEVHIRELARDCICTINRGDPISVQRMVWSDYYAAIDARSEQQRARLAAAFLKKMDPHALALMSQEWRG